MKIVKGNVGLKGSNTFDRKLCNVFRYEIHGDVTELYTGKNNNTKHNNMPEEAFASLSKDTQIYSDWIELLAGD